MAIRQFKPVTKSIALPLGLRFRGDHADARRRSRCSSRSRSRGGRDNHGHISMRRRGGGHKRKYRIIDFKRNKLGDAGHGARDRVRSEPLGAHRAGAVRGRREALHPAPEGAVGRRHDRRRARARTCASATRCRCGEMPLGTAVHNVELKPGKGGQMAARPACRRRSSRRKASTSRFACRLDRSAAGARQLPRDDRRGRQRRARAGVVGQGRQDALDGAASRRCAAKS